MTLELRKLGHEAYSCDLLPASGGRPDWHIQGGAEDAIQSRPWDMMLATSCCASSPRAYRTPFEPRMSSVRPPSSSMTDEGEVSVITYTRPPLRT